MKRTVVAVAVAAVCLVGSVAVWRGISDREIPAAKLVPAETLILADFPDLLATAIRWKETALFQILSEPQIQAFLTPPQPNVPKDAKDEMWNEGRNSLARIQPRRAFFAVTNITNNIPLAVGGFAFSGDQKEIEKFLAKAWSQAQSASPNGKLEQRSYGGFQIESFSDKGITVATCFARNWFFVSNDIELLQATLDRVSGKTLTTLASAKSYVESLRPLPRNPDFRLFLQPNGLSERLLAHFDTAGPKIDPVESAALKTIRAIGLATRMEGPRIRDTLFLYEPEAPPRPVLNGKTLGLTTPHTVFYGAMAPLIADEAVGQGGQSGPGLIPMRALLASLNSPPATIAQFKTAFGPEHAILLDWENGVLQPNLYFALEIRNQPEARRFMETAFRAWNRADAEGVSFWTLTMSDPSMNQFHPTVALTANHLLAGLSPESLKPFASNALKASSEGLTLQQSTSYIGAMTSVSKPETAMAYLDAKPVFEHLYELLRPAALLWGSSLSNRTLDFTKFPDPQTISKHLSPLCLSASQTDWGLLIESTGPISFLELSAGVGTTAFIIAKPMIRLNNSGPSDTPKRTLPPSDVTPASLPGPSPH